MGISIGAKASATTLALLGIGLAVVALALGSTESTSRAQSGACDPSYPDFCVPAAPPDMSCEDLSPAHVNFRVYEPDTHGFDPDNDGVGCEDPASPPYPRIKRPIKVFAAGATCAGCGENVPQPTATPTATATASPTQTLAPGETPTATATPTATTSATPTATPTTPTDPTSTLTPGPTISPEVCSGSEAFIFALDKSSVPETVVILGSGDLSGWYLISESGNQRFNFPNGLVISQGVVVESGEGAPTGNTDRLLWTMDEVWLDDMDDDARLYDCEGNLRSEFDDGF